jgi:hypothetical protein
VNGGRVAWVVGRIDYFDSRDEPHHSTVRTQWDCQRRAFVIHLRPAMRPHNELCNANHRSLIGPKSATQGL